MTRRDGDTPTIGPPELEATYAAALGDLRDALARPVEEREVAAFVRAARLQVGADRDRDRRPVWTILLGTAGVAAAAAALVLALTPAPVAERASAPRVDRTEKEPVPALRIAAAESVQFTPSADSDGTLATGTTLWTGALGSATLRDPATATLTVEPSTFARVASWSPTAAVVEVERGAVRAAVVPRRADQRFEIRTPYALVRVVGTDFLVRHIPGEGTLVEGYEGRVTVETLDGRGLGTVGAGESLRVEPPRVAVTEAPPVETVAPAPLRGDDTPATDVARDDSATPSPAARRGAAAEARDDDGAVEPAAAAVLGGSPVEAPEAGSTLGATAPEATPQATLGETPTVARASSDAPPAARRRPERPREEPSRETPAATPTVVTPPAPLREEDEVRQLRELLAAGRDDDAIRALETHANRSWQLEALLGDAYLVSGRTAEARAAYAKALEGAGERPPERLLLDLAELLERSSDGSAAPVWDRYLDVYPDGRAAPRALWRSAVHAEAAGRGEDARDALTQLLADFPGAPEATSALVRLGRLLLDAGEWDDAAELFAAHTSAREAPRAEAALVGLVRARIGQGRFEEARTLLTAYHERFPEGRRAAEARHLDEALPPSATAP